jgi:hypothetical protein
MPTGQRQGACYSSSNPCISFRVKTSRWGEIIPPLPPHRSNGCRAAELVRSDGIRRVLAMVVLQSRTTWIVTSNLTISTITSSRVPHLPVLSAENHLQDYRDGVGSTRKTPDGLPARFFMSRSVTSVLRSLLPCLHCHIDYE